MGYTTEFWGQIAITPPLSKQDKMHVWTHRRFHDAIDPRFMRYWLAVRTKIETLLSLATIKKEA